MSRLISYLLTWAKIDLSEYYEASDLEPVSFPNLKPTSRSISIRLPEYLIDRLTAEGVKQVAQDLFLASKLNLAMVGPFKDKTRFQKLLV